MGNEWAAQRGDQQMVRYSRGVRCLVTAAIAGLILAGLMAGSAPAQSLRKIKVVTNWFAQPEQATVWAALQAGIYKKHGLDVEIQQGGFRVSHVQVVGAGQAQFGMGNGDDVYRGRAQGIPLVAIFTTFQTYPQIMLYHKSHPLKDFKDINGRTAFVTVRSSFWQYLKRAYKLDQAKEIAYPGSLAPFLADEWATAQGYVTSEPYLLQLQGHTDVGWKLVADSGYNPYGNILYTTEQTLRSDPQMVSEFVKASLEGVPYYYSHLDDVDKFLLEQNPQHNLAAMVFSARSMEPLVKGGDARTHGVGYMTAARWQELYGQLRQAGVLDKDEDYTKGFTLQFVGK